MVGQGHLRVQDFEYLPPFFEVRFPPERGLVDDFLVLLLGQLSRTVICLLLLVGAAGTEVGSQLALRAESLSTTFAFESWQMLSIEMFSDIVSVCFFFLSRT